MITKLTKKQEEQIPVFIEKWIKKADEPLDRELTIKITKELFGKNKTILIAESIQNSIDMIKYISRGKKIEYSSQLGSQLDSQLYSQLGSQLDSQLYSQLDSQLDSQLRSQLGSQLYSQLEGQLGSQLGSQLDSLNCAHYTTQYWLSWYGYYDFAKYIGVKFDNKIFKRMGEILKAIPTIISLGNIFIVIENPKCRWKNGVLHSDKFPAIRWEDKTGIYFLNGVKFEKDLWQKIVSREMNMEDVLKIEDIDQRTQAIKYAKTGLREFYLSQNGKMIDEVFKLDVKGRPVKYELWKLPKGEIFNREVAFVIYDCPSSIERGDRQEYASGVPTEFNKVAEAMAWKMSDDILPMSEGEWLNLIPLKDES